MKPDPFVCKWFLYVKGPSLRLLVRDVIPFAKSLAFTPRFQEAMLFESRTAAVDFWRKHRSLFEARKSLVYAGYIHVVFEPGDGPVQVETLAAVVASGKERGERL